MKTIIKSLVLLMSAFAFSSSAQAQCLIYISNGPQCRSLANETFLQDSLPGTQINSARCLQRAIDYHSWCGFSNKRTVTAYFSNGSDVTVANSTNGGHLSYLYTSDVNRVMIYTGVLDLK